MADWIDDKLGPPMVQQDGVDVAKRASVNFRNGPIVTDMGAGEPLDVDFAGMTVEASGQRKPVRFAVTAALPAYTRVGNVITANAPSVWGDQDGVTPVVGDRCVLTEAATANDSDNWIYTVTQLGSVISGAPLILTRASDSDTSAKVFAGCAARVTEGTIHAGRTYRCVTAGSLNTDAITTSEHVMGSYLDSGNGTSASLAVDGIVKCTAYADRINISTDLRIYGSAAVAAPETIASNRTLVAGTDAQFLAFTCAAGSHKVILPASTCRGLFYWIECRTTGDLSLRTEADAEITILTAGQGCWVVCSGAGWFAFGKVATVAI